MVGRYQKQVNAHQRTAKIRDAWHSEWQDGQVRTIKELQSLEAENTLLKQQKSSLEIKLKHKSAATIVAKTDGIFGKSETDWEKELRHLEEIDRVRNQNERLWFNRDRPWVLRQIELLKQQNAQLRTEIQSLQDQLETEDKLETVSTNLYLVRNSY